MTIRRSFELTILIRLRRGWHVFMAFSPPGGKPDVLKSMVIDGYDTLNVRLALVMINHLKCTQIETGIRITLELWTGITLGVSLSMVIDRYGNQPRPSSVMHHTSPVLA